MTKASEGAGLLVGEDGPDAVRGEHDEVVLLAERHDHRLRLAHAQPDGLLEVPRTNPSASKSAFLPRTSTLRRFYGGNYTSVDEIGAQNNPVVSV